jgi:hypothetical protein
MPLNSGELVNRCIDCRDASSDFFLFLLTHSRRFGEFASGNVKSEEDEEEENGKLEGRVWKRERREEENGGGDFENNWGAQFRGRAAVKDRCFCFRYKYSEQHHNTSETIRPRRPIASTAAAQ